MAKLPYHTPDAVLWHQDSDEVAKLVGYFFMTYSLVEESIRGIYATLVLRAEGTVHERTVVLSYLSMGNQIDTIRRVLTLRDAQQDWPTVMLAAFERLKPLTTQRNRLAHRLWDQDDDGRMTTVERGHRATKLKAAVLSVQSPEQVEREAMESDLSTLHEIHRDLEDAHLALLTSG